MEEEVTSDMSAQKRKREEEEEGGGILVFVIVDTVCAGPRAGTGPVPVEVGIMGAMRDLFQELRRVDAVVGQFVLSYQGKRWEESSEVLLADAGICSESTLHAVPCRELRMRVGCMSGITETVYYIHEGKIRIWQDPARKERLEERLERKQVPQLTAPAVALSVGKSVGGTIMKDGGMKGF
eukprot:Hpha_TRINITY_DN37047_c0_g1::TRINITY_DN37047_c0_g1_i1::g.83108::m.83108